MWKIFDGSGYEWDCLLPFNSSFHQHSFWGKNKVNDGWSPLRLIKYTQSEEVDIYAQVLIKKKYNIAVVWVPGCPIELLSHIDDSFYRILIKSSGVLFVYCRISVMTEELGYEAALLKQLSWKKPSFTLNSGLNMILDLNGGVEEVRKRFSKNWRHNLKRSNKYGLTIERWNNPNSHEMYLIYKEMEEYKGIKTQFSLRQIQSTIDNLGKNLILFCCSDENDILLGFRGIGIFGNRCLDMFAASTTSARKVYATYGLFWSVVQYCCANNIQYYDLGGIDPVGNPGVYNFKKGTGAREIEYLGEWEWDNFPLLSYIVNHAIRYRGLV